MDYLPATEFVPRNYLSTPLEPATKGALISAQRRLITFVSNAAEAISLNIIYLICKYTLKYTDAEN